MAVTSAVGGRANAWAVRRVVRGRWRGVSGSGMVRVMVMIWRGRGGDGNVVPCKLQKSEGENACNRVRYGIAYSCRPRPTSQGGLAVYAMHACTML